MQESTDAELQELEAAYEERWMSLHKPATTKYMVLWDLGSWVQNLPEKLSNFARLSSCLPPRLARKLGLEAKEEEDSCRRSKSREELGHLRKKVNQQRWSCWETHEKGLEVSMLSGKTWKFTVPPYAKGHEIRERVAELSGLRAFELELVFDGRILHDDEVFADICGNTNSPPSLQLLRVYRPRALTCSSDCTLRLWDMEKSKCVSTLTGHGDGVICIKVDWTTQYALSSSHDCSLRIWDLDHGICVQAIDTTGHPAFCLSAELSAARALTGSWDNNLKLWDTDTGICLQTLSGHQGLVQCLAMDWDTCRAVSGSHDATLRLWDLTTGACLQTLQGHHTEVSAIDVDFLSSRLLSGSHDHTLRLWNLESFTCIKTLRAHSDAVSAVSLSLATNQALSASYDRTVLLWDLEDGVCLRRMENGSKVTCMSVDWPSNRFITGSEKEMKFWDLESGRCLDRVAGHLESARGYTDEGVNVSVGHMDAVTAVVLSTRPTA